MANVIQSLSTHSGRLERWLGKDQAAVISASMRPWYGRPIAVAGVPGAVYAAKGGDFVGKIKGGYYGSLLDYTESRVKRILRNVAKRQSLTMNTGFASLSDLISEATTGGKKRTFTFQKAGNTGVVGGTNSLWRVGPQPVAAAAASAAPGGNAPTDATSGAFPFTNPGSGDTQHFVRADVLANANANTLLLYDRIFHVAKTMNSTATEAVTGVPTRYQSTTGGAQDSAENNFLFMDCGTVLAATAHNWTVCLYTDQGGTTGVTLPSVVGNSGNIVSRLDMPVQTWFAPLATDDTGIKALTQMQCSALVATGAIDFVIGHPIAIMPLPVAQTAWILDGINSAFNLTRVFDDACLSFLELCKPSTNATTYAGIFETVAG